MPRPRLTADDYQARLEAYCRRHGVEPTSRGIPPFPAGSRETPQHREWISLHRLHDRISRRARGQCQSCPEPAPEGQLFCEAHAGGPSGAPAAELRRLYRAQGGACPICERPLALDVARLHAGRALLHGDCLRLVRLAESVGSEALSRTRRYLARR